MSNNYFKFKHFTVFQDLCAMKVGTDGTLLGAWAEGGDKILDIGTGTGLIALMMAQRYPGSCVTAIDMDEAACRQAEENVLKSPFADRVEVLCSSVQDFSAKTNDEKYDAIVSNPPYFVDSLECPDKQRAMARHASSLTFGELFSAVSALLSVDGCFSAIIPAECLSAFDAEAALVGLRCIRRYAVHTVVRKPPKRYLVAYSKSAKHDFESQDVCLVGTDGERSEWYSSITSDFYL